MPGTTGTTGIAHSHVSQNLKGTNTLCADFPALALLLCNSGTCAGWEARRVFRMHLLSELGSSKVLWPYIQMCSCASCQLSNDRTTRHKMCFLWITAQMSSREGSV